jgi:hypothetical protein
MFGFDIFGTKKRKAAKLLVEAKSRQDERNKIEQRIARRDDNINLLVKRNHQYDQSSSAVPLSWIYADVILTDCDGSLPPISTTSCDTGNIEYTALTPSYESSYTSPSYDSPSDSSSSSSSYGD